MTNLPVIFKYDLTIRCLSVSPRTEYNPSFGAVYKAPTPLPISTFGFETLDELTSVLGFHFRESSKRFCAASIRSIPRTASSIAASSALSL